MGIPRVNMLLLLTFSKIASLDHKVLHHTVKGGALVVESLSSLLTSAPFPCSTLFS